MYQFKTLICLILITSIFSCSEKKGSSPSLIGTWQLTAQLIDPGDGSGEFQAVQSEKTIEFKEDETVISNGDLCSMSPDVGQNITAPYSKLNGKILPKGCKDNRGIIFLIEEDELILYYPCVEACGQKYKKKS